MADSNNCKKRKETASPAASGDGRHDQTPVSLETFHLWVAREKEKSNAVIVARNNAAQTGCVLIQHIRYYVPRSSSIPHSIPHSLHDNRICSIALHFLFLVHSIKKSSYDLSASFNLDALLMNYIYTWAEYLLMHR